MVAIAHGLFDLLLFGPTFLAGGFVPTYAAPTLGIVAVVVASALLLIVLCDRRSADAKGSKLSAAMPARLD